MNQKIIVALFLLVLTSCSESSNNEYELSDKLKEKALAAKKVMLNNGGEINENIVLEGENQQNSPKWVLKQVFKAAKTGDFSILTNLCDPIGKIDAKAQRICNVANTSQKAKDDFTKYFEHGKITGYEFISSDSATVQITFGNENTSTTLINFINRDSTWYLSSFD